MKQERGRFIVLYGANNLGKTTQAELTVKHLQDNGLAAVRIKYPVYDLEPTGPQINAVLRQGVQMSEDKVQQLYAQNRRDYQPKVHQLLEKGTWIVGEDYTGTGIAWGLSRGLTLDQLEQMNDDLLKEDLGVLIWGERFKSSIEAGHRNETNDQVWQSSQANHLMLAERYGWQKVTANQPLEQVQNDIWQIISQQFDLK